MYILGCESVKLDISTCLAKEERRDKMRIQEEITFFSIVKRLYLISLHFYLDAKLYLKYYKQYICNGMY